jgi:SAM-dependent methyltransferase
MFCRDLLRTRASNRAFRRENPDFRAPPARLAFDAYHNTELRAYQASGLIHARLIAALLRENLAAPSGRVCEWGCGPARVIRHLPRAEGFSGIELYGTDYNEESIRWCKQYIGGIEFHQNQLEPPLPFPQQMFDGLYGISVFTHLSEDRHRAWIDELYRVLKPGGILILTTHGNLSAQRLLPEEKRRFDEGQLVVRDGIREGKKHFLAYHPEAFIRARLLNRFTVLRHVDSPREHQLRQDVWVAQKPTS